MNPDKSPQAVPEWAKRTAKRQREDTARRTVSNRDIAMRAVKLWGRK
jgi:hypothetical protein